MTPKKWSLSETWGFDRIGLQAAHDRGLTGAGVTVVVVDVYPRHGTEVSDVVRRVAPGAYVQTYDINDGIGNCSGAKLLTWMQDQGGGPPVPRFVANFSNQVFPHDTLRDAAWHMKQRGWFMAAAAGNNVGAWVPGPAHCPDVCSVGAWARGEHLSDYSGTGKLDMVAPGDGIPAFDETSQEWLAYGTSFAAPLVAGAAALVWEQHPDWLPGDVWAHLYGTSEGVTGAGRPLGLLNIGAATE